MLRERRIKNKDYRRLLMAIIVSEFGDVLFDLFIVWKITMDSQNIMNAAYMLGSSIAFRGILSLGIGIIIDKYNKKKLIIGSNILSALIIATFAVAYPFVIGHIMVGIAFILVNDICNAVFWNTYTVIASEKFPKEEFITFQSNSAMCTRCVQIAMFCCGICMLSLMVIHNWFLVIVFLLYGVFDALTQPMFSYMITRIDEKNRGKILGGIDALLLLSPSFGIAIGTKLIAVNYNWAILYLTIIFAGGFLMVTLNRKLNHLKV